MTSNRLVLIVLASAALSLSSVSLYAQTPSAGGSKPSTIASPGIEAVGANAKIGAVTRMRLSDSQMDGVSGGLDLSGFLAAQNSFFAQTQNWLASLAAVENANLTGIKPLHAVPPPVVPDPTRFF